MRAWGRRWRDAALSLIFPPVCVHCGGLVESGDWRSLCSGCAQRVAFVSAPHCHTCGYPFHGEVGETRLCPHCIDLRPVYNEGRTLSLLRGPLRSLVHTLKYGHGRYVLDDVETVARRCDWLPAYVSGAVLVPVPLHRRRLAERGFNQSRLIAERLAKLGRDVRIEEVLMRVVDTPTQTRLDKAERLRNLKNAFALRKKGALNSSSRYLLVDDVFTTGSTVNTCASVLRSCGVRHIDVVTLGHG